MNDYLMIHLATERRHEFERAAQRHRLVSAARSGAERRAREGIARQRGARERRPGTLRMTLGHLLGRSAV